MNVSEMRQRFSLLGTLVRDLDKKEHLTLKEEDQRRDFVKEATKLKRQLRVAEISKVATGPVKRYSPPAVVKRRDPFDLSDVPHIFANGRELRGEAQVAYRERARRAVDQIPFAETRFGDSALRAVEGDTDGSVCDHILRYGSPTYRGAFHAWLKDPSANNLSKEQRAALSTGADNGGYLLPVTLDPKLLLTSDGATSPIRSMATHRFTSTNTFNTVTSDGVQAEWLAEATSAADKSPTVSPGQIAVEKASATLQASFELLEDSGFEAELLGLLQDARDRIEATASRPAMETASRTGSRRCRLRRRAGLQARRRMCSASMISGL